MLRVDRTGELEMPGSGMNIMELECRQAPSFQAPATRGIRESEMFTVHLLAASKIIETMQHTELKHSLPARPLMC